MPCQEAWAQWLMQFDRGFVEWLLLWLGVPGSLFFGFTVMVVATKRWPWQRG